MNLSGGWPKTDELRPLLQMLLLELEMHIDNRFPQSKAESILTKLQFFSGSPPDEIPSKANQHLRKLFAAVRSPRKPHFCAVSEVRRCSSPPETGSRRLTGRLANLCRRPRFDHLGEFRTEISSSTQRRVSCELPLNRARAGKMRQLRYGMHGQNTRVLPIG